MQENPMLSEDPYTLFLFGIKASETKRKYLNHLDKFFHYLDSDRDKWLDKRHKRSADDLEKLRQRCKDFIVDAQKDKNQALYSIVNFCSFYGIV